MNFTILHVGNPKENYYKEAFAEYQKRIGAFGSLEDIMLKPALSAGEMNEARIREVLLREAEEFREILSLPQYRQAYKVALCIEGKQMSSEEFAEQIDRCAVNGKNRIVFLIGGSWGIDEEIKKMCDFRFSFSKMTFAHSLFRVMLAEQLYRALSILSGGQYHK